MEEERAVLSIMAQFDDTFRKMSLIASDNDLADYCISLVKAMRDMTNELYYNEEEVKRYKDKYTRLESSYRTLEVTLKNVKECYKKEVSLREVMTRERDSLFNKLRSVRELLNDNKFQINVDMKARERVLSCLDCNLTRVEEVNESGGDCLSDMEYDKSEDDCLDLVRPPSTVTLKRASSDTNQAILQSKPRLIDNHNDSGPVEVAKEANESVVAVTQPKTTQIEKVQTPPINFADYEGLQNKSPFLRPMNPSDLANYHSQSKLENRKHAFVQKKLLKTAENCTVCNTKIGFYSTYYRCSDCRACCHMQCKTKLPLPCIPYAPKENIGKKGRLITIADYVNLNSRPCIPALIIHCCNEIERRGLSETGLYRIPGSDKEIRELTEKILSSKSGIPMLSSVDVHVLCGVIKNFLNRLDDPLITRVLWRDFVDAAKIEDPEDRRPYICQAITELPVANRHTLAYLVMHLQRIASSPACNMPITNLAKVLGPTIIGYSTANATVTVALYSENLKQIKAMEALLSLPHDYWNSLIVEQVTNHAASPTIAEAVSKRQSIGSRVVGGSLQSEVLNPCSSKSKKKFRPLF